MPLLFFLPAFIIAIEATSKIAMTAMAIAVTYRAIKGPPPRDDQEHFPPGP